MAFLNLRPLGFDHPDRILVFEPCPVPELYSFLGDKFLLSPDDFYLTSGGRKLCGGDAAVGDLSAVPRLPGGKGGFGSMLRAIGAQIEKTTNREACRDLSGRRLRDINEEQRLKKWISQQADREKEAEERKRKKLEKLSSEPKFDFKDKGYAQARSDLTDGLFDSFEEGIKASTSLPKRKAPLPPDRPRKKKKLLIDMEETSSSSSDEEESHPDQASPSARPSSSAEESKPPSSDSVSPSTPSLSTDDQTGERCTTSSEQTPLL